MTEQTPELVGKRIEEFFSTHQTNPNQVSLQLGNLTQQIIMSYMIGERFPNFKFLFGLKKLYPSLSFDWLLLGEGEMEHTLINNISITENKGAFSGSQVNNSNNTGKIEFTSHISQDDTIINSLKSENERLKSDNDWLRKMLEMSMKKD